MALAFVQLLGLPPAERGPACVTPAAFVTADSPDRPVIAFITSPSRFLRGPRSRELRALGSLQPVPGVDLAADARAARGEGHDQGGVAATGQGRLEREEARPRRRHVDGEDGGSGAVLDLEVAAGGACRI